MEDNALLLAVMRSLGSAWRASRLYPPDSPMTAEAVQRICDAVEEYVQAEPSLKLDVVREGFILRGLDGVLSAPGVSDLTDALGEHGVGELHFLAPPSVEEVLVLLTAARQRPHELHEQGGMQVTLTKADVGSIRVVPLVLSKIETPPEIPEEEADKFLSELAADAGRLAVWLRSLLASDDEGLAEGIETLATAAGDVKVFGRTMAAAFLELETDETDRLLEISISLEPVRHISVEMLANLSSLELTAAIRGGRYGANTMALSFALTSLPIGDRSDELLRETVEALRAADAGKDEIRFLEQMMSVRRSSAPELALVEARREYRTMHEASRLTSDEIGSVQATATARRQLDAAGVTTVMHLLDAAGEFEPYTRVLGALARSVPHLMEAGDADLAMSVVRGLSERSLSSDKPWPGLDARFAQARDEACGMRSMAALLAMHPGDEHAVEHAKELVALGGEVAAEGLAGAAMESEAEDSMDFAEAVLGRRLPELLAPEASHAEARHAAKLAELYTRDGGPRCMQAIGQLVARPEDRVRARTARGIGAAGGAALTTFMPTLLRDPSQTVVLVAADTLANSDTAGIVEILAERLSELEGDKDLRVATAIIGVLAESPSPAAEAALDRVANRGGLLRRGRHAEMRRLAKEALDARQGRGGA